MGDKETAALVKENRPVYLQKLVSRVQSVGRTERARHLQHTMASHVRNDVSLTGEILVRRHFEKPKVDV